MIVEATRTASGRLQGRRALVTGGAKGIGAAIARAFLSEGAVVTVADIDSAAAQAIGDGHGAAFAQLDATDFDAVHRFAVAHGPFDILVNNAGVDQHAFFTETGPRDWERLIAVNLVSVLNCTHAVLPAMQKAGFGRIVNVSSEAARLGSKGGSVYAAAKGGVIAFTRSIARENARYGITANVIAPGPIETPMVVEAVRVAGPKLMDAMVGATLVRRLGKPEEVAEAAVYLASDAAAFVTGETLGVSGGMGIGA